MADYSTTAAQISILFLGDCWAQCQLHASIRYVVVTLKHEIAGFCGGGVDWPGGILLDGRFLYNHWVYSNSVCWRLLGLSVATQRYKVRLYRMKTQEVSFFCGGNLRLYPGGILLDGWFLHNHRAYYSSVCWRLLGSSLATQRYKVRPHRMKTQEVADLDGGSTLAEFYAMADYSTTAGCIPILFSGDCWTRR